MTPATLTKVTIYVLVAAVLLLVADTVFCGYQLYRCRHGETDPRVEAEQRQHERDVDALMISRGRPPIYSTGVR